MQSSSGYHLSFKIGVAVLVYTCELGWLLDPDDRSVLVFKPHQQPVFCHQNDKLTVIDGVDLELTVEQVFSWLKMKEESEFKGQT